MGSVLARRARRLNRDARRIDLVIGHALVSEPAMQPVRIEAGFMAGNDANRFAAARRLRARHCQQLRQRFQISSRLSFLDPASRHRSRESFYPARNAASPMTRGDWNGKVAATTAGRVPYRPSAPGPRRCAGAAADPAKADNCCVAIWVRSSELA